MSDSQKPTRRPHLTALVSWAHRDSDWTDDQVTARRQDVVRFVTALRTSGIDADADFYHSSDDIDWTRWGPGRVRDVDIVLIIASQAWKDAWEGRGDKSRNTGAAAEASALLSMSALSRDVLQSKCRLILLPNSSADEIPDGLHGVNRYRVDTFDQLGLEELMRDLTDQPLHVKPPLGKVPVLPPALTDPVDASIASEPATSQKREGAAVTLRRSHLQAQLDALPTPQPGEGPHLPWFREWARVQQEIAALDDSVDREDRIDRAETPRRASEIVELPWTAVETDVDVSWISELQDYRYSGDTTAAYVHLVPIPPRRVSARVFSRAVERLPQLVREFAQLPAAAGLDVQERDGTIVVRVTHDAVPVVGARLGGLRGLRLAASGSATSWAELPRDNMGAILDPETLTSHLTRCIRLAAAALMEAGSEAGHRVAIAAEISPVTLLTDGTMNQLGARSSASMPGAMRNQPVAMYPQESLPLETCMGGSANEVAAIVIQLLRRSWAQA